MCSITPRRIAVIGSDASPVWSGATAGGVGAGFAAAGAAGATGAGAAGVGATGAGAAGAAGVGAAAACPPASMNARMSFFVTRPPVPVPGTALGSTPCSAAIRATTGDTKVRPFPAAAGCACGSAWGAGVGAGGESGSAAAAGATGSGAAGAGSAAGSTTADPAGAITASTVPTSTVSPSATRISATMPSPGLGTSVSTLSVEISSSGSSWAIGSPGCFSHFVIVPSETDTPIWGITTSICVPVATFLPFVGARRASPAVCQSVKPCRSICRELAKPGDDVVHLWDECLLERW